MNQNLSKITVIIRAYNPGDSIKSAIKSVLSQTLDSSFYETVIIDDGSTEDLAKILGEFNNNIKVIRQRHLGPVGAANTGIKNSKGEYIILLDSDDTFSPSILEEMINIFSENNDIDFVYCDYYEKVPGKKAGVVSLKDNIFNSVAAGIMFKKSVLEQVGGYNENFVFAEYDLLIRLKEKGCKGRHIPRPLYSYKRRSGSITSDKKKIDFAKEQIKKKYGEINIRAY